MSSLYPIGDFAQAEIAYRQERLRRSYGRPGRWLPWARRRPEPARHSAHRSLRPHAA